MTNKNNLLKNLFTEASSYTNMDAIEALVQKGMDLSHIPVQPLYLALKALPLDKACAILPKMSQEQRVACLDLDLWVKDNIDTEEFGFWVEAYSICPDEEVRKEFIGSTEFFLYLKSRFNIWTFDLEEPEYPDHDNYFLTEDNLLLFEFDDDFPYVSEIRSFVRELYGERGVEGAYTYLFKMVSESYMNIMEEEYQEKKGRLRDLGFVDYFDSLEVENTFANLGLLNNFIKNKKPTTARLDAVIANQSLHNSSISAYKNKLDTLSDELAQVEDQKRIDYLQFNFVRLVNSTLSFGHALREGPVAMTKIGIRTSSIIELGFDYLKNHQGREDYKLFDLFDFHDLYKVGHSLITFVQKPLKKTLAKFVMEEEKEAFMGSVLNNIIDNAFSIPIKTNQDLNDEFKEVNNFENYQNLEENLFFIGEMIPFIHGFYNQIEELQKEGKIRNEFYLNYEIAEIDFECLLLTSLANFKLGHLTSEHKKLGLTPKEYRTFAKSVCSNTETLKEDELNQLLNDFAQSFGLSKVKGIKGYLCVLLESHMTGYDFDTLPEEDFKHVGGPIILNLN